jgi:hypothetical protein
MPTNFNTHVIINILYTAMQTCLRLNSNMILIIKIEIQHLCKSCT